LAEVILTLDHFFLCQRLLQDITLNECPSGQTSDTAYSLIREDPNDPSLLFDNYVSSDDQGLAAAKNKNSCNGAIPHVGDRDPGDAFVQSGACILL
jgi:hypothetical protein